MGFLSTELGIDLGTALTRIVVGNTVVVEEPTVVAIAVREQKIVEVGREAYYMYGRVPETIEVAWPLRNGVIADYEITEKLLEYLIKKASGSFQLFRPKVMVTIPYGVTSIESRAVQEACLQAGSREVFLIQQPLAAALGAGLPIGTPSGNMILSMGAGTTQAAVLAMFGIVAAETIRFGGIEMDEAIATFIRRKYGILIGQKTAEQIKINIGAAVPMGEEKAIEVQGQDQVSGLPKPVTILTNEVIEALQEPLHNVVETARRVLEKTPPELVSDIIDRGLALCGGASLLPGLDKLLTKDLGVPAYLVDNPTTCTAEGAAQGLLPGVYAAIRRNLPLF